MRGGSGEKAAAANRGSGATVATVTGITETGEDFSAFTKLRILCVWHSVLGALVR